MDIEGLLGGRGRLGEWGMVTSCLGEDEAGGREQSKPRPFSFGSGSATEDKIKFISNQPGSWLVGSRASWPLPVTLGAEELGSD